jgi:NAD(P)-dependent dehydrogenase (short-subunit alcohol dehydrogenase family)
MGEWSGRVAFITGGSQGIGRATAELLAAEGASVAVCGLEARRRRGRPCARSPTRVAKPSRVPANVADAASIGAAVEAAVERYGRLDVLVTSAGIQRYGTSPTRTKRHGTRSSRST